MNEDSTRETGDTEGDRTRRRRGIVPGIIALIAILAGGYLYLNSRDRRNRWQQFRWLSAPCQGVERQFS